MLYDIEMSILALTWFDDTKSVVRPDELPRSLFSSSLLPVYDKVMAYRRSDTPWDIVLSNERLGADMTTSLLSALGRCAGLSLYRHYVLTLKRRRALADIETKIETGQVTKSDFDAISEIMNATTAADAQMYNLNRNLLDYTDNLEKRASSDYERYDLGLPDIDKALGFILPGMLVTIGGFSGMGKTSFSLKIFTHLIKKNVSCLFLSSEMGYYSLLDRIMAMESGVSASDIRNGDLTQDDWKAISQTLSDKISYKPGWIYEVSRFDLDKIHQKIDETHAKFVILDFIQMFRLDTGLSETRASTMAEIVTTLKEIAMEKKIIVIALSQFNKEGALKESAAIEEKSDIVLKLLKPENAVDNYNVRKVDVAIHKNRYGGTGLFHYGFSKLNCGFLPIDERYDN